MAVRSHQQLLGLRHGCWWATEGERAQIQAWLEARKKPKNCVASMHRTRWAGPFLPGVRLQEIPALATTTPDHRAVVCRASSDVAVGGRLGVGHHLLDG